MPGAGAGASDASQEHHQLIAEVAGLGPRSEVVPGDGQEPDRCLRVQGVRFPVVPVVLALLRQLADYVGLCQEWDSCGPELARYLGMLLRHFNQQMHKLVLGGQAVQLQTLKKINATHLALCCQCCSLLEALIPGMQDLLVEVLREEGAPAAGSVALELLECVEDLTNVVTDFALHRLEIFDKLSALLRERYEAHAKRWLGSVHPAGTDPVSWAMDDDGQRSVELSPHTALEGLVRDITALYTVLTKSLSAEMIQKIFGRAFAEIATRFEQRLGSELLAPSPPYDGRVGCSLGDRLIMDVAFLQEQLGKLSFITMPLKHLLADLVHHLRTKLPEEDPLRRSNLVALEALQRSGQLPR